MARKRWAVRGSEDQGGHYWVCVGGMPDKPEGGWHKSPGKWNLMFSKFFERFFPKRFHLPFDGGPVEIEFKV